ncbi:uncharacterized protein LOC109534887 [Dendroctonus ponderosae]|uniref:RAP domain-containing protein n=1 Tax=Dendroctonus ponderosae TaxID=77166 RepID=U4UZK5_DENPD|nr:uncharacterized protein LOC109534887 [Dendroctonus ponderosae]XP_019756233.2 uncharacterized protein LOC109534887 [Dendroctonus ponderosae]XP_019756234.2 uncharacterized protein LOC109534887 [Dendroctonus ponderosae]XP_019756236.2 uncharacterized protein LOC109534887 [Dendroctonus ponderosae]XP_048518175.1 uncharacterized protein LOC125502840 [Dendroctonus ponderosae]XP_048518177.1 uncharacterized protein LOC125502840 [Dendroctonus ponderosae]XP_048518178.1 uncharacterized protein LOC12550
MFALSRAICRTSANSYGAFRSVSITKNPILSGDLFKPLDNHEEDSLLNSIRTANSPLAVFEIVHKHHRRMNERHSIQAINAIFQFQRDGNSSLSPSRLANHPDFAKICEKIKKHAGVIDVNDAIDTLKVVSYVGIPAKSLIVQVMLQVIRNNVNSLNIPHILFLDFLLRNFETTPLVEALKIALPLVFEIHVPTKLNTSNPVQMVDCLNYAVNNHLSQETITVLIENLESYPGEFDGETARRIICYLCQLPRNSIYQKLLEKASTDLVVNIDNVPIVEMEFCLNRLAHRSTNRYGFYYQEVLFDTCANYIIDHNIDYKRAIRVLRNMARVHHCHKSLLDYVSTHIFKNPSAPKDPVDIYSIAVNLVLTDYKPVHWEHLKEWMKSAPKLAEENRKEIIWIRFAAALCHLDIYRIDVLSRALNEGYVSHLIEKNFYSNYEQYFTIWQCLTTYKPDLAQLLPANLDPKDLIRQYPKPERFVFEGALEKALGGKQFVLTDLLWKLGARIDHAIIFENNSPVPFQSSVEYVDDIKVEDNQQLVLIQGRVDHDYTKNTSNLRGLPARTAAIMEDTLKCSVIPINVDSWEQMNDFEKIPYLMQQIKEKLHLDIDVAESAL